MLFRGNIRSKERSQKRRQLSPASRIEVLGSGFSLTAIGPSITSVWVLGTRLERER